MHVRKNSSPFVNHDTYDGDFVPSLKAKRWKVRPGRIISWAVQTSKLMLVPRGRYMTEHPRHLKKDLALDSRRPPVRERERKREFFGPWGPDARSSRVHRNRQLRRGVIKVSFNCSFILHVGTEAETTSGNVSSRLETLELHFASMEFRG